MRYRTFLLVALAFAITTVVNASPAAAVSYFPGHCADASHVQVATWDSASDSDGSDATLLSSTDVAVTVEQAVTGTLECVNDTSYTGNVYLIVPNGKPDKALATYKDGATAVYLGEASAAVNDVNSEIEHTNTGAFQDFRGFDSSAADTMYTEFVAAGCRATCPQ